MSELPKYSSIVIKIPAKMLYGQHLKPSLTRKLKNVAHTNKKPAITLKADTKIKKAEIENKGEMTKRKVVKPKVVKKKVVVRKTKKLDNDVKNLYEGLGGKEGMKHFYKMKRRHAKWLKDNGIN
jgi:hypothetical protein